MNSSAQKGASPRALRIIRRYLRRGREWVKRRERLGGVVDARPRLGCRCDIPRHRLVQPQVLDRAADLESTLRAALARHGFRAATLAAGGRSASRQWEGRSAGQIGRPESSWRLGSAWLLRTVRIRAACLKPPDRVPAIRDTSAKCMTPQRERRPPDQRILGLSRARSHSRYTPSAI